MGKLAQQLSGQSQVHVYKKGGKVHEDEAADKKLIKEEFKKMEAKEPKNEMKKGGKVKEAVLDTMKKGGMYKKNMMKKGGKV